MPPTGRARCCTTRRISCTATAGWLRRHRRPHVDNRLAVRGTDAYWCLRAHIDGGVLCGVVSPRIDRLKGYRSASSRMRCDGELCGTFVIVTNGRFTTTLRHHAARRTDVTDFRRHLTGPDRMWAFDRPSGRATGVASSGSDGRIEWSVAGRPSSPR